MARLFTFGCSFTATEHYPSWSNFLGLEFDHYENWAVTGIGCRAIAERIAECHVKNKFTKDDIVIVQWTTHLRHDYYNPDSVKRPFRMSWKTAGNMFNLVQQDVFTEQWIKDFFHEPGYVLNCLNYMILTQALLKSTGCKWFMTSIGEWTKLGSDLHPDLPKVDIHKQIHELVPHCKSIWEDHKDHWIEPIGVSAMRSPELAWYFNNAEKPGEKYLEAHPSPRQYVIWLNEYLRPKLGLGTPPKEQELWLDQLEQIKEEVDHYCLELLLAYGQSIVGAKIKPKYSRTFWPPKRCWPLEYLGF
jgi:hypothetical protein